MLHVEKYAQQVLKGNLQAITDAHSSIERIDSVLQDLKYAPDAYLSVADYFRKRASDFSPITDLQLNNLRYARGYDADVQNHIDPALLAIPSPYPQQTEDSLWRL